MLLVVDRLKWLSWVRAQSVFPAVMDDKEFCGTLAADTAPAVVADSLGCELAERVIARLCRIADLSTQRCLDRVCGRCWL
jgi:hypothetical protein